MELRLQRQSAICVFIVLEQGWILVTTVQKAIAYPNFQKRRMG